MKKKKQTQNSNEIVMVLEAGNGFSQRLKREFVPEINIPFMYRIRISDPVISDRFDLDVAACGKFLCYRRTKKTAWYRLSNLTQVRNPEAK